jgi:hypothetical protein
MTSARPSISTGESHEVFFESAYGGFPKFIWYVALPVGFVTAAVLFVRATAFGKGISLDAVRISANMVAWIICPAILLLCGVIIGCGVYRFLHPQRVVVALDGLHLPKGRFSDDVVHICWEDLTATWIFRSVEIFDVYEVTCIDSKHGTKARITSALFRNFDDFATFALIVGRHMGEDWSIKGFLPGTYRGRKKIRD